MSITVFHLVVRGELEALAARNTTVGVLRDQVRMPFLSSTEGLTAEQAVVARRNLQVRAAITLRVHRQYVDVAVINTDDLDVAFRLTNTIEQAWVDVRDARITKTGKNLLDGGMCYSSSVGDIFRNDTTQEFFVCAPMGWVSLGKLDEMIADLLNDPSLELGL